MKNAGILAALVTLAWVLAAGGTAFAQDIIDKAEKAKRDDIRKLMKLTGSAEVGKQVMDQLFVTFKQSMPSVPPEFWDKISHKVDANEMVELIVPIYAKYFSHDEIRQLIKFYESPLGKKLTKVLPDVTRESMEAGQKWGQKLAEEVMKEIREKGY